MRQRESSQGGVVFYGTEQCEVEKILEWWVRGTSPSELILKDKMSMGPLWQLWRTLCLNLVSQGARARNMSPPSECPRRRMSF